MVETTYGKMEHRAMTREEAHTMLSTIDRTCHGWVLEWIDEHFDVEWKGT